jgi:hypothetical protein
MKKSCVKNLFFQKNDNLNIDFFDTQPLGKPLFIGVYYLCFSLAYHIDGGFLSSHIF